MRLIDTTPDGRRNWASRGMYPLTLEGDGQQLQAGDTITDRDGKGVTLHVNACYVCGKLMLGYTMIIVPITCDHCKGIDDDIRTLLKHLPQLIQRLRADGRDDLGDKLQEVLDDL